MDSAGLRIAIDRLMSRISMSTGRWVRDAMRCQQLHAIERVSRFARVCRAFILSALQYDPCTVSFACV